MKILQVCHVFKPLWESGGIARVAYEITRGLVERGHELTIYTTNRSLYKTNLETNKALYLDGMNIYYFENLRKYFPWRTLPPLPYYLPFIAKKEVRDFDVIHIHGHRTILAVIVHHYAKKYGTPYVLQAHGSVLPIFQKQRLKKIFDLFFGYRILRDASKVIALTKTEAEQYKKMGVDENKIEIVPNGIDLSEYDNLPKRGEFRKKYSIKDDEKIILYVGRLHKSKGINLLIKAFADLSKKLDSIKLVFIGPDGGYQSTLERVKQELKIDTKVVFTGFVTTEEKTAAFVDADIFVTPSFSGFPVTFLEACACGTPIITTNNGDELDWIDGKIGYVVEYDNDQLRDAIIKVLSDEELRRRFGEEGRRLVREEFGWKNIVEKMESLYEVITLNSNKAKNTIENIEWK